MLAEHHAMKLQCRYILFVVAMRDAVGLLISSPHVLGAGGSQCERLLDMDSSMIMDYAAAAETTSVWGGGAAGTSESFREAQSVFPCLKVYELSL